MPSKDPDVAAMRGQLLLLEARMTLLQNMLGEINDDIVQEIEPTPAVQSQFYSFKLFRQDTTLYRAGGRRCVIDNPWEVLGSREYGTVVNDQEAWMRYKYTQYDEDGEVVDGTGKWDEGYGGTPEVNEDQMVFILGAVKAVSGSSDENYVAHGWIGDIAVHDVTRC